MPEKTDPLARLNLALSGRYPNLEASRAAIAAPLGYQQAVALLSLSFDGGMMHDLADTLPPHR